MEIFATLNPDNLSAEAIKNFQVRRAARAVIFDADKKIGLLRVSKDNYYKLPGGGIEEGEEIKKALERECEEELGCDIAIDGEIGRVIEYRTIHKLNQESFCFYGHIVGEKGIPDFTESEVEHGFQLIWVDLDEAIRLLKISGPVDQVENFIIKRDSLILEKLKEVKS
jgi:8-oxo-dGTP pyrophosphatase MutT (NUDIX family)